MYSIDLIDASSSTGPQPWIRGSGVFAITGTFGGASVQLEWSADGETWANVGPALTAAGVVTFARAAGYLQAVVSGGNGTDLAGTAEAAATPLLVTTADGATGGTQWDGGNGVLSAVGAFAGSSLQLECLGPDGATWLPVGAALAAAGMQSFNLPRGEIQATVTGGAGVAITATAAPLPTVVQ